MRRIYNTDNFIVRSPRLFCRRVILMSSKLLRQWHLRCRIVRMLRYPQLNLRNQARRNFRRASSLNLQQHIHLLVLNLNLFIQHLHFRKRNDHSPVATTSAASSGSSSHAVAIGAGVGVPVGILAWAGIGFLFWRHRRNEKRAAFVNPDHHDGAYGGYTDNQSPQEVPGSIPMGANGTGGPKKGYWGGRQYEPTPQEMPLTSPHLVHEMPTEER